MLRLNELQAGSDAKIAGVKGDTRFLSRITSIGLTIGCEIRVLRNEGRLPLMIFSRDSVIALNRNECNNIMVEVGI